MSLEFINVNSDNFNEAMDAMSRLVMGRATKEQIIRAEAGKVLSNAVKETVAKAPTPGEVRAGVEKAFAKWTFLAYREADPRTKGATEDGVAYRMQGYRYPDALWLDIRRVKVREYAERLRAIGGSAVSWVLCGKAAGIEVDHPPSIMRTVSSQGKKFADYTENAGVSVTNEADKFGMTFRNSAPGPNSPPVNGAGMIRRILEKRASYFRKQLEFGTFADLKKVAARYPHMKAILTA